MLCLCFFFNHFCQTNHLNIYYTDLYRICRIGRTEAVDEQSEVSFSVTHGWLGSWVHAGLRCRRARVQIAVTMLLGNSLWQTVRTHCASVHQAAKLVAALLRVSGITAGLAESNGSLLPGLWLTSPAGWLPRTGISCGTLRSVIVYGLPLPFSRDVAMGTNLCWFYQLLSTELGLCMIR